MEAPFCQSSRSPFRPRPLNSRWWWAVTLQPSAVRSTAGGWMEADRSRWYQAAPSADAGGEDHQREDHGAQPGRAARRLLACARRGRCAAQDRRGRRGGAARSRRGGLSDRPAQVQQVRVHAVGRLRHQRVALADQDVGHEVGVQQRPERLAADGGERVLDVELLGAQPGADGAAPARRVRAGRRSAAGSSLPPDAATPAAGAGRLPRAATIRSSGTSRRLSRSTSAGVMPASMATLASAAALLAASQPSMSLLGSASA